MPRWPHEYTVREWRPDLEPDFLGFAALIRSEGVVKPWPRDAAHPRYHHTYLELDGWEYWTMGSAAARDHGDQPRAGRSAAGVEHRPSGH